jgi:putative endonuclease
VLQWLSRLLSSRPHRGGDALGDNGENLAARHLRNQGLRIITRNYRCELGEVDIIARDGPVLVFVEVKTRVDEERAAPEQQVDRAKQHQLTRVARHYLSRYGPPQPPARFDVVAVVWPKGHAPAIRHTPDAFDATF